MSACGDGYNIQGRSGWLVQIKFLPTGNSPFKMDPVEKYDSGWCPKCVISSLFMEHVSCAKCYGGCQEEWWVRHSSCPRRPHSLRKGTRHCCKRHEEGPLARMEGSEASWGRPHQNCNKRGRKAQPDSEWGHEVALHAKASAWPSHSSSLPGTLWRNPGDWRSDFNGGVGTAGVGVFGTGWECRIPHTTTHGHGPRPSPCQCSGGGTRWQSGN